MKDTVISYLFKLAKLQFVIGSVSFVNRTFLLIDGYFREFVCNVSFSIFHSRNMHPCKRHI